MANVTRKNGGGRNNYNENGKFIGLESGNNQNGGKVATVGSKAQVFHGTAKHTSGGLVKSNLMKTKAGRIVSKKKHAAGKKAITKLRKLGYVAKKGTFKLFKKV
jgi:hypothetical protein